MVFLAVLVSAVPLLYFWLIGHWFARVLTFLALLVPLSFLGSAYGELYHAGLLGLILGGVATWFMAGIPTYYWRRRLKQIAEISRAENTRLTKEAMQRFNAQHGLIG